MRGQVKSATAHFQAATLGPDPVRINHASGGGVLYGIFEARCDNYVKVAQIQE